MLRFPFLALLVAVSMSVQAASVSVYFGTYTGGESKGIYHATFDTQAGTFGPLTLVGETENPSFLALHPNMTVLYSVSEVRAGGERKGAAIVAWKIDSSTGQLTEFGRTASGSDGPCHVTVHPNGKFAAIANYAGGSVTLVALDVEGKPVGTDTVKHHGQSGVLPTRQEAAHAHCVRFTPNGQLLMVTDLGLDRILAYQFESGKLQERPQSSVASAPGAGPRHMRFTPDGSWLAVINELNNTVASYRVDAAQNSLSPSDAVTTLPEGYSQSNSTAEICIHPNGRWVYGSNRGHDSIAVFELNGETGKLKPVEITAAEVKTPRNFNLIGTDWLVAVGQDSSTAQVFKIDLATGRLTSTKGKFSVPKSVCVLPLSE
jgi:6-phosphogluconolactonase